MSADRSPGDVQTGPNRVNRLRWSIGLFVGIASAAGIIIRAAGYPPAVPEVIRQVLTAFIEPGLAIWWLTAGGVFQAFPSDATGYVIAAIGNIGFWCIGLGLVAVVVRRLRRRADVVS